VSAEEEAGAAPMTRVRKAAIVLLNLGNAHAAQVLAQLDEVEVQELTAEIVRLESVPPEAAAAVMTEFHQDLLSGRVAPGRGGIEAAHKMLQTSFGAEKAAGMMGRLQKALAGQPFDFLEHVEPRQVRSLLSAEHPQTIALVLANLRPERSSAIMSGMPAELRADVAMRIAMMERASPEVVTIVADRLEQMARAVIAPEELTEIGGLGPLVKILNRSDPATEKQILDGLGAINPQLAAEVRGMLFTFDDIVSLDDKAVQLVLRQTEMSVLAMALKGAPDPVKEKAGRNLSERARQNLEEEIELSGRVKLADVQEARGSIVKIIRSLEESGLIVIQREGEDDDYVS
jgi:flagellar motor switch protein FliG